MFIDINIFFYKYNLCSAASDNRNELYLKSVMQYKCWSDNLSSISTSDNEAFRLLGFIVKIVVMQVIRNCHAQCFHFS